MEITIQDISIPTQSWTASVEVHIFWQDFSFQSIHPKHKTQDFLLDDDCVPLKMSEIWENRMAQGLEVPATYKYFEDTSTLYMMFVSKVVFVERMELHRFPLDRQFLNMEFNAWVGKEQGNWNWMVYDQKFAMQNDRYIDWVPKAFHKPFAVRIVSSITEYELLTPWIEFAQEEQPLLVRLRVDRKPEFYFGNIVLPNFLIVAGCFAAYPVPQGEVADRLSVTVNLMLAAVAFRFVVETMLPKVNYLTLMDYYLLVGFIALTLLIGENAIAGIGDIPSDVRSAIDWGSAIIFGLVWIVLHILCLVAMYDKEFLRKTWEVMDQEDKEEGDVWFRPEKPEHVKYNAPISTAQWNEVYKKIGGPLDRANYYRASHALPSGQGMESNDGDTNAGTK